MTKTKTIQHEYGEEKIEVVECSSCGQEAKVQKMREYRIYDNECENYVSGSICPNCRDLDNPLEYPSLERTIQDKITKLLCIAVGLLLLLLTASVCLVIVTKITELISILSGTLEGGFLMGLISLVFLSIMGNILGFTEE